MEILVDGGCEKTNPIQSRFPQAHALAEGSLSKRTGPWGLSRPRIAGWIDSSRQGAGSRVSLPVTGKSSS